MDTADALGAAVSQLDSNLPTYFGGTPARLHNEILGVKSYHRYAVMLRARALRHRVNPMEALWTE